MLKLLRQLSLKQAFYFLLFGVVPFAGGGGSSKKESQRADDLARQERMRAEAQAAELRRQQEAAAAQLAAEIAQITQRTPLETQTIGQISPLQTDVEAMLRGVATGGAAPVQTPLGLALQERLLADLGREPEDVFVPNLRLLEDRINQISSSRGILGSGLHLEQLGRTGVDLAIQQALAREQLRADQVNRALAGQQSLETIGVQRRGELSGFLQNLQALEDARRAREIGTKAGAAQTGASLRQVGNVGALDRLSTGEGRALGIEAGQLERQAAQRLATQQALQGAVGDLFGQAVQTGLRVAFPQAATPLAILQATQQTPSTPSAGQLRAAQRQPSGLRGGFSDFYERFQ